MATKAKKGTEQTFYDTFGEWSAVDQAAALKTLSVIHDQTKRMERKLDKSAKPGPVKTTPVWPCGFCGGKEAEGHLDKCPNRPAPVQQPMELEPGK